MDIGLDLKLPKILWLEIGLTFGIGDFLALPKRVNLSLELGTIVWFFVILHTKFQLPTTPRSGIKNFRL